MRFLMCFSFCVVSSIGTCVAQKRIIDSLLQIVGLGRHDTAEAYVLDELSSEFARKDMVKSLQYSKESLTLSKRIGYQNGICNSYAQYCITNTLNGKADSARHYLTLLRRFS